MFNRMTEEEAVIKTKEKVKGLENQIAQKPRGWFPETVNAIAVKCWTEWPTKSRNEKCTRDLTIGRPYVFKLVRLLGCRQLNPLKLLLA